MSGGWPAVAITVLKNQTVNQATTCIAHGLPASLVQSSGIRVYSIVPGVSTASGLVVSLASVNQGYQAGIGFTSPQNAGDSTYIYAFANAANAVADFWVGPDAT